VDLNSVYLIQYVFMDCATPLVCKPSCPARQSRLTFLNNESRVQSKLEIRTFGLSVMPIQIRRLNVQTKAVPLQRASGVALEGVSGSRRDHGLSVCSREPWGRREQ
jgi:hypothetical protein